MVAPFNAVEEQTADLAEQILAAPAQEAAPPADERVLLELVAPLGQRKHHRIASMGIATIGLRGQACAGWVMDLSFGGLRLCGYFDEPVGTEIVLEDVHFGGRRYALGVPARIIWRRRLDRTEDANAVLLGIAFDQPAPEHTHQELLQLVRARSHRDLVQRFENGQIAIGEFLSESETEDLLETRAQEPLREFYRLYADCFCQDLRARVGVRYARPGSACKILQEAENQWSVFGRVTSEIDFRSVETQQKEVRINVQEARCWVSGIRGWLAFQERMERENIKVFAEGLSDSFLSVYHSGINIFTDNTQVVSWTVPIFCTQCDHEDAYISGPESLSVPFVMPCPKCSAPLKRDTARTQDLIELTPEL